ncbi:GGDEF domain-containing protein [Sphingomonas sp.]|jgi:diguanylate cyclase|uniref:GGDEF domain-containing protein n=1 Tax=Sphingomonas sp. TaxID=28214 RepID=UPI002ED9BF9C
MRGANAARRDGPETELYDRIGLFLAEQRLSADPDHYRFAHAVLSNPGGPIARAVEQLVDGRLRLRPVDIERLCAQVAGPRATSREWPDAAATRAQEAAEAGAREQADGFADMVRAIYAETRGFGQDLAASAAAFERMPPVDGLDEIARIAGTMIARVHDAESRLATATREADTLREKLAEASVIARRDSLTGLPNRRAFEEAFADRASSAAPWCLALCDVDRFKRINDEHGHPVGDRVLGAVARILVGACEGHLVARHGGEEFAVLLKSVTLSQAAEVVEEARAAIAVKRFRDRDTDAALGVITMSVGLTAIQTGDDIETAFERADRLLYTAKAGGRNQVATA